MVIDERKVNMYRKILHFMLLVDILLFIYVMEAYTLVFLSLPGCVVEPG